MKRKHIYDLIIIALFGLVFLYFQYYTPRSAVVLSQKIDQTTADDYDAERLALSKEYQNYLSWFLLADDKTPSIGHYYIGKQRKLLDIRVKQAIEEIKNTPVADGKVRIWSLLNMGAVIKSSNKIIVIDAANLPFVSHAHDELANIADVFLTTHSDADHYGESFLSKALTNNKKIVFPEGFYFKENSPSVYKLKSGQRTNIGGLYVTSFKTDHRGDGNFKIANCWYLIEVSDIKILHSGDGLAFQNPTEIQHLRDRDDIDIFLANLMLSDENIRDINPKMVVPLHLFKFMHSQEELDKSTFESAVAKYEGKISGIELKLLFAGESFEFPGSNN